MKIKQSYPIAQAQKIQKKKDFQTFLNEYYRNTLVNSETIFNTIGRANRLIKNRCAIKTTLIEIDDVSVISDIRKNLLVSKRYAFGNNLNESDPVIVLLDRYADFLNNKLVQVENQVAPSTIGEGQIRLLSDDELEQATEGMSAEVTFFRKKRNRKIRLQCAKNADYKCYVCGMDFESVYGERGHEFIEVHHLKPISFYEGEHNICIDELCALCSNCHSMVHHGKEVLDVNVLKEIFQKRNNFKK